MTFSSSLIWEDGERVRIGRDGRRKVRERMLGREKEARETGKRRGGELGV